MIAAVIRLLFTFMELMVHHFAAFDATSQDSYKGRSRLWFAFANGQGISDVHAIRVAVLGCVFLCSFGDLAALMRPQHYHSTAALAGMTAMDQLDNQALDAFRTCLFGLSVGIVAYLVGRFLTTPTEIAPTK